MTSTACTSRCRRSRSSSSSSASWSSRLLGRVRGGRVRLGVERVAHGAHDGAIHAHPNALQTRLEARSNFVMAAILTAPPFAGVHVRCCCRALTRRRSSPLVASCLPTPRSDPPMIRRRMADD